VIHSYEDQNKAIRCTVCRIHLDCKNFHHIDTADSVEGVFLVEGRVL